MDSISPLVRAILIRSYMDLDSAIKRSPESLVEKTYGLTVLHLSVGWPAGLSLLLKTSAKSLIDTREDVSRTDLSWPFSYAAAKQCPQSLDILLQAGCSLFPYFDQRRAPLQYKSCRNYALSCALEVTSAECAKVFARHIALRQKEVLLDCPLKHAQYRNVAHSL